MPRGWRAASASLGARHAAADPGRRSLRRRARDAASGSPSLRLGAAIGLVRTNRTVAGAALVSALLGVVDGVSGLLVPLALAANGLSAGGIGLAFGISAAVWIASATLVGRLRASAVHLRGVGVVIAVLAARLADPRAPPLDARPRRVPRRLDRVPLDDQRARLRRRRARERGDVRPDGDRRHEPRVGRDGARRRRCSPVWRRRSAGVRLAFAATGAVALGVALVMLAPRPGAQDRLTPIVIAAT